MSNPRTELHREVVEALVSSKAVNFEAVGAILSKYGARAAVSGDAIGVIINKHMMDICIPPEPYVVLRSANIEGGGQAER